MEQAVAEPFRYASLIARHISERCGFLTPIQVEGILDDSGLELVEGQVRTKAGGPVDEDAAYRYKQAIKNRLGSGAYTMTRVNFKLVGCRCKDCRMGLD